VNLRVGTGSDVGKVRQANEDAFLAEAPLFAVADGMGGHLAGDVASATAVDVITQQSASASLTDPQTLSALLRAANRAIWEKASSDPSLKGMGTTCTLVMIEDGHAQVAHVGDSRAYLLRDGELTQLTDDHTLVSRMVKEGRLREEEAARHPQRSIITRALGVDADVEVDLDPVELVPGDRLLINSDGLTSMVDPPQVKEILVAEREPQRAADRLIEIANDAGGEDNITVVVIDVEDDARNEQGARTAEPPPAVAPREDTTPHSANASPVRWRRALVITIVTILVLGGGGYAAARYFLHNSFFVGANDDGYVAIYRGIPDEIAGLDLKTEEEATDVPLTELPEFKQEDVAAGIKVESLDDAESTVSNLRTLAEDFSGDGDTGAQQPNDNTSDNNNGGTGGNDENKKRRR
jgi:PPM family protein phosphatase